jgi:5-methylthioadenosine/S-adenosylhomocysteine deaminase
MKSLVLHGGTILTMDPARRVIEDGVVVVEGQTIRSVGPAGEEGVPRGDSVIDLAGRLLMPGLVNAHTHLCMIFGRTLGVERDLLTWLGIEMPLIRALDEQALYLAELLGCVENLKNGNTTIVENIFTPQREGFAPEAAAFRAMKASGVRGVVARGFHARNFDNDFVESADQQSARVRALAAEWNGAADGRLGLSIGPLLPWIVNGDELRATAALARDLGIKLHMHVAESPEFNRQIERYFGRPLRNVELLHEFDCLGRDAQVVAVADVNDREIELLAASGTSVIFDPQTRLFWGTGFPPIKPFLDAGLVCGLGTNGPAANCGQDLFESMKYACATAKTAAGKPDALTRSRALSMATIEGARALGLDGHVGSIEPGKKADLVTIDLAQPHLTPAFDLEAALVYAAKGADVRDAVVDGAVVMRNRRMETIDEEALLAEANAAAAHALRKAGIDAAKYRPLDGPRRAA